METKFSPLIMLYLESIGMDHDISELYHKGRILQRILQRNYREMTISWSFSYNSLKNSVVKINWGATT